MMIQVLVLQILQNITLAHFPATKYFPYKQGTGANDVELGFPITYLCVS